MSLGALRGQAAAGRAEVILRKPVGPPPLALRLASVLVVPLVLYAMWATGQKALDYYRLQRQADHLRTETYALRDENLRLQQQIRDARSDAAIEEIAREQLGLAKPGDHALILASPQGKRAMAPPPPPADVEVPPWQRWWRLFFDSPPGS